MIHGALAPADLGKRPAVISHFSAEPTIMPQPDRSSSVDHPGADTDECGRPNLPGDRESLVERNPILRDAIRERRAFDEIHDAIVPSAFSSPWMCAMFGWFSAARTSASR